MKFAIRDDDLNYHYAADVVDRNLRGIFETCPVSMAAIPFVKGNWIKNTETLERAGPRNFTLEMANLINSDDKVYSIAENSELVAYITAKVKIKQISVAIHGIHHRAENYLGIDLKNNFSIGAEFYTSKNLAAPLEKGIASLETCFGEKIKVFTPPQNAYTLTGALAVYGNKLNLCAYLPSVRDWRTFVGLFGRTNFLKYFYHRLGCKQKGIDMPFPYVMRHKGRAISDHCALQTGTSTKLLLEKLRRTYYSGGHFVLSTHSYAFGFKMNESRWTMKECLKEILNEALRLPGIKFVTLNEIFE
jgi:hypothetical protein